MKQPDPLPSDLSPGLREAVARYVASGYRLKDWSGTTVEMEGKARKRDLLILLGALPLFIAGGGGGGLDLGDLKHTIRLYEGSNGVVWRAGRLRRLLRRPRRA